MLRRSARSATAQPIASTSAKRSASPPASGSAGKRTKIEIESSLFDAESNDEDARPPVKKEEDEKPKKKRSPAKFVLKLEKAAPTPKRWREAYDLIAEQRKSIVAAVDTMGCEQGGREADEKPPSEKDNRLSILVSLMLSSQTKDPVTFQAAANLRKLPGGLTIEALEAATPEEINACINKVGFHNIKTKNLKKLATRLRDEHNGDVPTDLQSLLAIDGVGPKMAILTMNAMGFDAGIGVDVHVHRITNRLGWHKTEKPEQTRLNLESWLPKEFHGPINKILVGFGQEICKPVGPRCDLCNVAKVPRLCPSKQAVSPRKKTPSKLIKKLEEEDGKPELPIEVEAKVEVKVEITEVVEKVTIVKEEEGLNW